MPQQTIAAECLATFAIAVYKALGMPDNDAALLADTLVQADLWGHQSHGVMRTFWYAKRIQSGATKAVTAPELVSDMGAVVVLDGNDGVGQVIAAQAMREAVHRSRRHGVGVVSVRNSGHFGTAMYFTRIAASEACIGFLSTNASPAMAPWGGCDKLIGANPWSIAAPAGRYAPMLLDIANTAVARGKLYMARQRNEAIPEGWAIDRHGRATTDPVAGIAGNILPMAGHKGYVIATMMDVLSGVLSGSKFANDIVGPYIATEKSGVGHLAMALNIAAFRSLEDFNTDMEHLIERIKGVPRANGVEEIYYPGELEALSDKRNRKGGIILPNATVIQLDASAQELGIATLSSLTG